MPRGDWGIVATLVGCLILASVGLWHSQIRLNNSLENGYPSYEHTTQGPTDSKGVAVIPKPEVVEYRKPCERTKGRDESDLCAQWRAAKAAENSASLAEWGFWITVAGAFGLFATIIQGRVGLARAREANKISREIGEAQVRAYLSVESARLVVTETMPFWEVTIKNSGQSPAAVANLKIVPEISYMDWSVLPDGQPLTALDFRLSEVQCGSFAPGETRDDTKIMFLPSGNGPMPYESLGAIIMDPNSSCWVSAMFFLKWIDVFGIECDATGMLDARSLHQAEQNNNGVIGFGETDVSTSVYDTAAWFDRRNEKKKVG